MRLFTEKPATNVEENDDELAVAEPEEEPEVSVLRNNRIIVRTSGSGGRTLLIAFLMPQGLWCSDFVRSFVRITRLIC